VVGFVLGCTLDDDGVPRLIEQGITEEARARDLLSLTTDNDTARLGAVVIAEQVLLSRFRATTRR
jgi:hypothetical protein